MQSPIFYAENLFFVHLFRRDGYASNIHTFAKALFRHFSIYIYIFFFCSSHFLFDSFFFHRFTSFCLIWTSPRPFSCLLCWLFCFFFCLEFCLPIITVAKSFYFHHILHMATTNTQGLFALAARLRFEFNTCIDHILFQNIPHSLVDSLRFYHC